MSTRTASPQAAIQRQRVELATRWGADEIEQQRRELLARIDQAHAHYPQYAGHWDDWKLAVMVERNWAHGATLAEVGDLVLLAPPEKITADGFVCIHAERYGVDCHVRDKKVRELS